VNALTLAQTEHAYYRGMAAAYMSTQSRWGCTLDGDLRTAFGDVAPAGAVATEAAMTVEPATPAPRPSGAHPDPVPTPPPSAAIEHGPPPPDEPTIGALAERFGAMKIQLGEWTKKTAHQAAQSAALLARLRGLAAFWEVHPLQINGLA